MKKVKIGAMMVIISLLSLPVFSTGIKFEKLSLKAGLEKAKKENKKVFIDIYATWCGPCKYLTRSVFVDHDLGDYMNEHFVNLKLDGEKEDGGSLMSDFDLNSFPTMLFLDPNKLLLKKIVGAVSAEEIKNAAIEVIDPESTVVFQLTKEFNTGNREKEFLEELILEQFNSDKEYDKSMIAYRKLFPVFNLEDEDQFLIFCLGISEKNDTNMLNFRGNIQHYKERFPEKTEAKISLLIGEIIKEAVTKKDVTIAVAGVNELFPDYAIVYGEDGYDISELITIIEEIVQEEIAD